MKPYIIGHDPGTRGPGFTVLNIHTKVAERMDIVDMFIRKGHVRRYHDHHYYDVARQVIADYDNYFQNTDLFVCEKINRKLGAPKKKKYYNVDVVIMHAYIVSALRTLYPHLKIRYVESKDVRAHWGVTVKRTKAESKSMSLDKKRLQNKKYSWNAKLMSDKNKQCCKKLYTVRKTVMSGKTKGKSKLELMHDAWESAMIAMYGLQHMTELLNQEDPGYITRTPTKSSRVLRMEHIQLFEAPEQPPEQQPEEPKKKRQRTTKAPKEPKPKRQKKEPTTKRQYKKKT